VRRRYRKRETAYPEILDVAATVFDERGYHESSVQDIADAAGLTKGGLYHHLSSKEATLFAINERYLKAGLAEIKEIVDQPDVAVVERLSQVVVAHAAHHDTYYPDLRVTLREFDNVTGEYREQLIGLRDEYERIVRRLIEDGINEGTIVDEDPEVLVMFVFGTLNWMCMWYRRDRQYTAAEFGQRFAELIRSALVVPAPAAPSKRRR
jgi:TetR/AcrR family transcriptional regulator, cholesterol catabolism regulator